MRLVAAALAAWVMGVAGSTSYASLTLDRMNLHADLSSAIAPVTVGLVALIPLAYLPLMYWLLSTRLGRTWWIYPAAGAGTCLLPFLVVRAVGLGPGLQLTSDPALYVYSIFAPAGATFGFVWRWFHRND